MIRTKLLWRGSAPTAPLAACTLLLTAVAAPAAPSHPLDPLGFDEHWTVLEVLDAAGRRDAETRFSSVSLVEPPKDQVWSWRAGTPVGRSALALVRQGNQTFEAVIDLQTRRLSSWSELEDAQPNFLLEELFSMVEVVLEHPDFAAGLRRRGYEDFDLLDCAGIPPGAFGLAEERGRRLAHVRCSDARGARNTWGREVSGLTAVVDLNTREVLRVVDDGSGPPPQVDTDYDASSVGELRSGISPVRMEQPAGRGFRLDGHAVEWQGWSFHVKPDPRVGTVISVVRHDDRGAARTVLYQGHLSEIFVPYMDPSFDWFFRNFIDAGEFSLGGLLKPLLPGRDCPEGAAYLDLVAAGDNGRPRTTPDAVCLFERYAGDMSWRHGLDPSAGDRPESRRKQDLVVRSAAVIGNYDYVFDWVFQQDGTLRVALGATGIVETKRVSQAVATTAVPAATPTAAGRGAGFGSPGETAAAVAATTADTETSPRADAYGRFVAPHVVAVNHDHYFNFRLDLDVDGPTNSFVVDRLVPETLPPDHPRRSIWVQKQTVARSERDAQLDMDMHRPGLWRVIQPARTNAVGYPTSYQLMPGMTAHTLLSPDDWPRRRAGFIDHDLWVTPYRAAERYAAGDHPTLSRPGEGLPEWTRDNRPIADTDIVLWHTFGMHHLPRAEDWPVMPVMWHGFELRPFDFFDRNPALDLPDEP